MLDLLLLDYNLYSTQPISCNYLCILVLCCHLNTKENGYNQTEVNKICT